MARLASLGLVLLWMAACGDTPPPSAAAAAPKPAAPAPPPPSAATPSAPNACDNPQPITLALNAGVTEHTPWGLDVNVVFDDDPKRGPGYLFQLRSGERRWETRRDNDNWTRSLTWRGFCWRGAERPERRSLHVKIRVAPVCKGGKLQELGGCGDALGPG
jgi:hypothetical protein